MDVPIWNLTRTTYGRRFYEFLESRGLKLSLMHLYRKDLGAEPPGEPPAGVSLSVHEAATVPEWPDEQFESLAAEDHVVLARLGKTDVDDGKVVGWVFLTTDRAKHVEPLETTVRFDGVYVWRLWVEPEYRERGIASALVAEGTRFAREELGCATATAFIAVDNQPSRWVFESRGFTEATPARYVGLFGWEHRSELLRRT
ncbi:GNAT family N-acetyltransferase [Haloarchaeobius amylolyticus]|uniref:GNAT family N-acetyltransferase n=1 Tax=Haloarchaeobius amylolyticus TaxID=1198296 RepID=UPI00226F4A40|nr:GNAT family N-acetyltransferase [Haloarchaeobius amylolyticus]